MMQGMRAMDIMRKIKSPGASWDTNLVQDNTPGQVPPQGQTANTPGIPSASPSLPALSQITQPPAEEFNPEEPLQGAMNEPSMKPGVDMDKLSALLKSRSSSKKNFLGGGM